MVGVGYAMTVLEISRKNMERKERDMGIISWGVIEVIRCVQMIQ